MAPIYVLQEQYLADQARQDRMLEQVLERLDRLTQALESTNRAILAERVNRATERAEAAENQLSDARAEKRERRLGWIRLAAAGLAGSLPATIASLFK
jgi:hypothetical protein